MSSNVFLFSMNAFIGIRAKERSGSKELFLVITVMGRMTSLMTMATKISGHLQPTFDH